MLYVGISSLIILGIIGLSGNGFAAFVPPGGGGSPPPPPPPPCDKYGFLFYATDAGHVEGNVGNAGKIRNHIAEYRNILLLDKGYSEVISFENVGSYGALINRFNQIKALEDEHDAVFIYIWGHGWWDGDDSGVKLNQYLDHRRYDLSSSLFNTLLNGLDTAKIGFLIDSCYSGGFVLDFQDDPYLAMTSADTEHRSWINILSGEALFSDTYWWTAATLTDNAGDCWNWAATWNIQPVPMYYNGLTTYTFF